MCLQGALPAANVRKQGSDRMMKLGEAVREFKARTDSAALRRDREMLALFGARFLLRWARLSLCAYNRPSICSRCCRGIS